MSAADASVVLVVLILTACRDSQPRRVAASDSSRAASVVAKTDSCSLRKFQTPALLPGFKDYSLDESSEVYEARKASLDSIFPIGWVYLDDYAPTDYIGVEMPIMADTSQGARGFRCMAGRS